MLHKITAKNFEGAVLKHDKPVVIDVWADWCGPCKMLAPNFKDAATALEGKARFVKLDADKNQKLMRKYKVMSLPTILIFKDGKEVSRRSGVQSKNGIVKSVRPFLNKEDKAAVAEKSGFNWKFWQK